MSSPTRRSIAAGAAAGVMAGILFALMEIVAAVAGETAVVTPFRMFASVAVQEIALQADDVGAVVFVGTAVHLGLAATFGLGFGALVARASDRTRTDAWRQVGLGALFGGALWAINVLVIGRVLLPWFVAWATPTHALLHVLAYGAPLGLWYASSERQAHRVRPAPAGR